MAAKVDPIDWSRNALWLSPEGQARVRGTPLVVVGCGGNGSVFTVNAAHVGFRDFTLCDADVLDPSNFNRYPTAVPEQIGRPKVEALRSYLVPRFAGARAVAIAEAFPNAAVTAAIEAGGLVIGALDDATARVELDVVCRKYGRTLIDLGSGFLVDASAGLPDPVIGAGGQVLVSRPGGPCLRCLGIDLDGVRNAYFAPRGVPEPSSLLLNGIIGALGAEAAVGEARGLLAPANRISYDRAAYSMARAALGPTAACPVCGTDALPRVQSAGEGPALVEYLTRRHIPCKTC